ncbi:MAG: GNAT family N-acetyltransferase [Gemmatimonadota bacterium]
MSPKQSNPVSYRTVASADVNAMLECRLGDADSGPGDARMRAYFEGQHHPQQALLPRTGFVAVRDGRVVGYIAGHLTTRHGCDGEVQYLYVAPTHRRHGVAVGLLRFLRDWFFSKTQRESALM